MYDTLIVGAGPIGSYIASRLAALGHRVIVFEQHDRVGEKVCTGIISKRCLDLSTVDRGVILKEVTSAKFFAPSGESLELGKDTPQAYIIDRPTFDSEMARKAQEEGAEYFWGSRVKNITLKDELIQIETENQGKASNFEGKTVAIASGFNSRLPRELGLGKVADFVIGAQAEVEANEINEPEIYFGNHIAPGFFAWLVPTSSGRALVGLLSRHSTGSYLKNLLSDLFNQGKIASLSVKISYGGIPLKPLPKTYGERVIVVGDAAGQVKPTTGGGIYYGLLCAEIAANTLHQALQNGDFSARAFAGYEKGWKKKLSRELRISYFARRLFERLSDRNIEQIFSIIQSDHIHKSLLSSEGFFFDWHSGLILRELKHLVLRGAIPRMWLPRRKP